MDPLIPPKSPVLECILQDPDPPKKEEVPAYDAEQGQISVDNSVEQESEKGKTEDRESESAPTPTLAPITTPSAPTSAPIATPVSTSVPAQTATPTLTPVPIEVATPTPTPAATGKMSRLQIIRQGIVHPQVGLTNFTSPIVIYITF